MKLNPQQEEAANHVDGPCLVVSVPGSGKTRLLVERTARLIESGVNPRNVVCVTFTNKAAHEMKSRICKRLNIQTPQCFVGTFHALCGAILRTFGERIGYSKKFTIVDSDEQVDLIRQIARQRGNNIDKSEAATIARVVNNSRENLWDRAEYERALNDQDEMIFAGDIYLDRLKESNMLDFSGMLSETLALLNAHSDVREKLQDQMRFIQCDEVQDTNLLQFELLNLFSARHKNIFLVGDLSQCVVEGSRVVTQERGEVPIETVEVGEKVLCGIGNSKSGYHRVSRVIAHPTKSHKIVTLTTASGLTLSCTDAHLLFADFSATTFRSHVVYLMYKRGMGYRVGTSRIYKDNTNHGRSGFAQRCLGESADKVWVLRTCHTEIEARYFEQLYSVQYSLPTWTFRVHSKGANAYGQEQIDRLFAALAVETADGAARVMSDLGIDPQYPHYVSKAMNASRRRNFVVTLCGDNRQQPLHCYAVSGSDDSDAQRLCAAGINVRSAKKGCRGWRLESATNDLGKIQTLYDAVRQEVDVNLIEQARLTASSLAFMPASNIHAGMIVFVHDKGVIKQEEVVDVSNETRNVRVYDLDVERCHNYVVNGIVGHNSIYRFRGARYQNITDFLNKHKDCRIIELSTNYRSTPQIVAAADSLIRNNSTHMAKKFEAYNSDGEQVRVVRLRDQIAEGEFVAKQIKRLTEEGGWARHDIAVLYRMNSMSEPIEQSLNAHGLPYEVIGGRSFYDRREVKDSLAMLRVLVNPSDGISFHRVAGLLPGLGDTTIGKIESLAIQEKISVVAACEKFAQTTKFKNLSRACDRLAKVLKKDVSGMTAAEAIDYATREFDYEDFLRQVCKDDWEDRIENVRQLMTSAAHYSQQNPKAGVEGYLHNISLMSSNDKEGEKDKVTLMTLHAAKGLEFPIVFMIGVEQNILPHALSVTENPFEGIEEERRLCYVGMTRAEKLLYMSYCRLRKQYVRGGQSFEKAVKPSQFLLEAKVVEQLE